MDITEQMMNGAPLLIFSGKQVHQWIFQVQQVNPSNFRTVSHFSSPSGIHSPTSIGKKRPNTHICTAIRVNNTIVVDMYITFLL